MPLSREDLDLLDEMNKLGGRLTVSELQYLSRSGQPYFPHIIMSMHFTISPFHYLKTARSKEMRFFIFQEYMLMVFMFKLILIQNFEETLTQEFKLKSIASLW
jgi:hypothetical protein